MRFGTAMVALLLLSGTTVGGSTSASDRPTLAALLARVRTASGAPYAHHVVSISHETADGRTFELRSESDGYRLLVRRCRDVVCEGTYFDGERDYDVNINDTALPRSMRDDDDERTLRAIASGAFSSTQFRADGGTIMEMPDTTRNGRSLRRLAVTANGAGALDVLIDPGTALPVATTSADGKAVFDYRDFRHVDGLTLPFEVWRDGALVDRYESRHVSHDPLRPPQGLVPAFDGAPAALPLQPGRRGRRGLPAIACSIGDVLARCLIDTGNSALGMSLDFAERLDLDPAGEFEVTGVGRYVTGLVGGGVLHVGNVTYPPAKYVVLHDLQEYGYDVVLGADVLANARVLVDYARGTVTFEPSAPSARDATIPVHFENLVPVASVRLGAFDVPLAIDTGDEASINLSYEYYLEHPGLFSPQETRQVGGIGGTSEQIVGEVASVRIATFDVLRAPIAATRSRQPTADGHIGSGFLAHFAVVLDYARARLGLTPRSGDSSVRTAP
jgi:hypothetical protein